MEILLFFVGAIALGIFSRSASASDSTADAQPNRSFMDDSGDSFTHGSSAGFADASFSSFDSSPSFNIDGTPMMGMVDINGNVYGQTSSTDHFTDSFHSDSFHSDSFSSSFSDDSFSSFTSGNSWD